MPPLIAKTLVDIEMLAPKIGTYRTGTVTALSDPDLLLMARTRRRRMGQIMAALDKTQAQKRIFPGKYLISRKIDGEFTCLVFRDGEVLTLNPYGTVRVGAPFHAEAGKLLAKAGISRAIIGGELYVRRPDGKRARVHDVCRIARAPETEADVASLAFAAFGIYDLDGADLSGSPEATLAKLTELFKGGDRAHVVETVAGDEQAVHARFKQWVEVEGGEGIVALSDKYGGFKIKPRHSMDLAVVGFSRGTEDRAGMLHSLLLAVVRDDGSYHMVGRTGGGFSDAERVAMLADLDARVAGSDWAEVNSDRVAYKMLKPGLVAEISCLDVIAETSDGQPIDRMVLEWDATADRWKGVRRLPLASIISPQFERLRDDKTPSPEDTGLTQLTRIVEIPDTGAKATDIRLPAAEILRRAVATKEIKGRTMVRKLLLWKTNKEQLSPEHPAFVLLLTDYSPNRKTPLEREIRVSSSLEQIEAYWTTWKDENFVKGWVVK